MSRAVRVEWLKFRRSRVPLVASLLMGLLIPLMGLGFYQVAISEREGALAQKAAGFLIGQGWDAYYSLIGQIAAAAVFVGIGVVVAWTFGREHVDRTFPSLFALPVSRSAVAGAKFVVLGAWILFLTVALAAVAVTLGVAGGIANSSDAFSPELAKLAAVVALAGMLTLPIGYVASAGRGYLPAIAALILLVAISQVAVLLGTGAWFSFAVPGLLAISAAEAAPQISASQLGLLPVVAAVGVGLTVTWWKTTEVV